MKDKCYIIPTQKNCNNDCVFCITNDRNYNKSEEYLKVDDKFKMTIKKLKYRNIRKFEITGGGEPLLNKDIQKIINTIKSIIPDSYIKLYTNGNIFKHIYNVDELNISVAHYLQYVNDRFMRPTESRDLYSKLSWFRKCLPNSKIRLSIPLIKGGIDSKAELNSFINSTSNIVDEYVVRTLYPKTPGIDNLYTDFDYDHPLVKMEKDNDVAEFNGLILWSDGNIYTNWELNKKINFNPNGYILLKPDSQTYINEIEKFILNDKFNIVSKHVIEDFVKSSLVLYEDKLNNIDYYKKVKKHLETCAYLFGDVGMILLLDKDKKYEEVIKDIYNLKLNLRKKYSYTGAREGYLKESDDLLHLNLVHAPDPNPSLYEKDINSLKKGGVLNKELNEDEWQLVKKYCSYRR